MAKDFKKMLGSKNLNSLIPTDEAVPKATPDSSAPKSADSDGKKPKTENGTIVTTFRVNHEKLDAIKAIAFWDRKKIQDVFDEALAMYIGKYPASSLSKATEEYKKRK